MLTYIEGERTNLWSSGGGVQSCATAVLIAQGKLPKPELAVMVDTEREVSEAVQYQYNYIKPLLESVGVEYHIIKKSQYTKHDITTENDANAVLPPFFTTFNGADGRQPSWCSGKWKTEVVHRFANEMYPRERGEPRQQFRVWIGFSTDELRRVRMTGGKWQNWYPLIDQGLNRSDCISLVEKAGLPTPPRSACWMCPNRHDREWNQLKSEQPSDFKKAVEFEKELQKKWPHLWLHKEKKPLDQIIFTNGTEDMFSGCNSGMCMV